jgi:hypothetical protein
VLPLVQAAQFIRPTLSGKSKPAWLICANDVVDDIEVVAKLSAGCERDIAALAMEGLCALLGRDLGLPIPQPYVVELSEQFLQAVPDADFRAMANKSSAMAFGSKAAGAQFSIFAADTMLTPEQEARALAILFFDAMVQNADRRVTNANCLIRGDDFAIFDHELAFSHGLILGWKPPWQIGSLQYLTQHGMHIFSNALRGKNLDFGPIRAKWLSLSDPQIDGYEWQLPSAWQGAKTEIAEALKLIKGVRDNFEECANEVQRVLK